MVIIKILTTGFYSILIKGKRSSISKRHIKVEGNWKTRISFSKQRLCISVIDPRMPLTISSLFPLSLESEFTCLFIYFSHGFLPAFSFPISSCSISPCPPATPNYSISNLIANLCPLLIDVGIYQLPAN